MAKIWTLNEDLSSALPVDESITFNSNNSKYSGISYTAAGTMTYYYNGSPTIVYTGDSGWKAEAYRTVILDGTPTDSLLTWLESNATKRGASTITCTIASLITHIPELPGITQGTLNFMQWWLCRREESSGTYVDFINNGTINLSGEFEEDYTFTVEMPADSADGNYILFAWMCTAESGTPDYNIDFPFASLSASDIMQIHEARRARSDFAYAGEDMAVSLDFTVPIAEIKLVNTGTISVPHQMTYMCAGFYPSEYNIVTNKPADSMLSVSSLSDTFSVLASAETESEIAIVASAYDSDGTLLAATDVFAVKHKAGQLIIFEYSLNYGEFAVNATTLKSIADKIRALTGNTGYMKVKNIAASIPTTESKSVTPTTSAQIITPSSGKVLTKVNVSAMPTYQGEVGQWST